MSLDPQVVLPTVTTAPAENCGVIVRAVLATKLPLAETTGARTAFGSISREIVTVCEAVDVVKPAPLAVTPNVMVTPMVLLTVPTRVTVQTPLVTLAVATVVLLDVHVYASVAVEANTGVASTSVRVGEPALLNSVPLPVSVAVPPVTAVVIDGSASRVNGTSTKAEAVVVTALNAVTASRTLRPTAAPVTVPAPVTVQTPVDWFTVAVAKPVAAPGPPLAPATVTEHVQFVVGVGLTRVSPVGVKARVVATFAFGHAVFEEPRTEPLPDPDADRVPVNARGRAVFVTPIVSVAAFAAVL